MGTKSRKREADAYDDDNGFVADAPKSKKAKAQKKSAPEGMKKDEEGNQFWEISDKRRVTVSEFRGKAMIGIREYYEKDGKHLPGKKGITMTVEQFSAVVSVLPQLENALADRSEHLPRPNYEGKPPPTLDGVDDDEDDEVEDKKPNFEATSDEDE